MSDPELAVIITVPDHARQILVRVPLDDPNTLTVDFRESRVGVWVPEVFFPGSTEKHLQ